MSEFGCFSGFGFWDRGIEGVFREEKKMVRVKKWIEYSLTVVCRPARDLLAIRSPLACIRLVLFLQLFSIELLEGCPARDLFVSRSPLAPWF